MAVREWVEVKSIHCQQVDHKAVLLEERIYPIGMLRTGPGSQFHVGGQKCSLGTACNVMEHACRWSFLNPNYDPFH